MNMGGEKGLGIWIAYLGAYLGIVASHHVCFIGTVYSKDVGSLRWVLPYEDPCVCTAIRPGGHLLYKPATGHYLEGLFLSEDSRDIHKFFNCPGMCDESSPLGVEHGNPLPIEDDDFEASSVHQDVFWYSSASSARLNYRGKSSFFLSRDSFGGWKPQRNQNTDSWVKVDLGRIVIVSGIITQGRDGEGDGSGSQSWVTQFKVRYRPSEKSELVLVTSADAQEVFNGNTDAYNTKVTNFFLEPVHAYSVRIYPVAWKGQVVLRFELLGCPIKP